MKERDSVHFLFYSPALFSVHCVLLCIYEDTMIVIYRRKTENENILEMFFLVLCFMNVLHLLIIYLFKES